MSIVMFPDVTTVSIDQALDEIYRRRDTPKPGGPSGRGWSSRRVLQQCPHLFQQLYVAKISKPSSTALEVGILFHQLLANHYLSLLEQFYIEPLALLDELAGCGVSPDVTTEARRLYLAYVSRYEDDYLEPLDVECTAQDTRNNSCRFDLIAKISSTTDNGIPAGTYIVEHKTSARMDANAMAWHNDGEILGQQLLWQRTNLDAVHGALRGVIVNLIGKTKQVQFARLVVPLSTALLEQHAADLDFWNAFEALCHATKHWPRSRSACLGRYGPCAFYDECAAGY